MCITFPGTYFQCFIIRSMSTHDRSFELSISLQINTKAVSSQQFRLTPRTENQCVPFCDYSEVQAKYSNKNCGMYSNYSRTCRAIALHIEETKTYLKNTMGEERLNRLALMNVHRSIQVDIGGVLDHMSKKNRRPDFLLQFTVFSYGCNLLNKVFF